MTDNKNKNTMTEKELNALANKIVSRMVKLKAMETWFDHVSKSEAGWNQVYEDLKLTEEEDAISESAKLMTLMNLFQDNEEYEKCAIVKNRLDEINEILKKY
jgi:adenine-specific DNA methylase|tara:strand:- start:8 stop:313 length:306 start_codon:yes stop_codon:yes gene_type:complete